tara:strand:- start:553 stop:1107 length:555 start_codon:yes stop_codon:yes gene_type:complete
MNSRLNHYLESDLTWSEACARFLVIEAKSASRRISWIASVMEMNWASFVLPIARLVTSLGINNEKDLAQHQETLIKIISVGLEQYQEESANISRAKGVLPCQIDDALRYSLYVSGLIEEMLRSYRPSSKVKNARFVTVSEAVGEPDAEAISAAFDALCSEPLKKYFEENNSEQSVLLCFPGRHH